MSYTPLGDAQLVYVPGMDPVVDPGSVPGELLGSGTGTIDGPHLKGDLRWSFFEEDCAWDPGILEGKEPPHQSPGRSVCRTYPGESSRLMTGRRSNSMLRASLFDVRTTPSGSWAPLSAS